MTIESIRRHYNVPAKRGAPVWFDGVRHIITGSTRGTAYLRIRPAEGGKPFAVHPTWHMVYEPYDLQRAYVIATPRAVRVVDLECGFDKDFPEIAGSAQDAWARALEWSGQHNADHHPASSSTGGQL